MTSKPDDPINRRKYLLKDPVAAFASEFPAAGPQQADHLRDLWAQLHSTQTQHREIQNQTRQLSRQIGEAKRAGAPIDALKQQVQEHSTQAKTLAARLKSIEEEILSLFEGEPTELKTEKPVATALRPRVYPCMAEDVNDISITRLNTEVDEWNDYVNNNPAASIYHRAEWRDLIQATFGHEAYYLFARHANGQFAGVLPLIRLKSRLFGDFMVSMPYFNYGGAVADHPLIEQRLMTAANDAAEQLGLRHIEYRDNISRADLPVRTDKYNMLLTLPDNENDLWQAFTPKLRAQIKRPQRENPDILFGSNDLLNDFYAVFARNMRDLGTPVYHKDFFRNILATFPQQSRIIVIKCRGQAIAAAFLLGHRKTLEIPWASTNRDFNHLSMNMLMYWEVLRFALKEGYQCFDFGRSSKDSGTYRFKQQWGAKPKPLFWHYWLADNIELPALNPSNPKYAVMIYIWQRLPVFFTNWLGPKIVKNLP